MIAELDLSVTSYLYLMKRNRKTETKQPPHPPEITCFLVLFFCFNFVTGSPSAAPGLELTAILQPQLLTYGGCWNEPPHIRNRTSICIVYLFYTHPCFLMLRVSPELCVSLLHVLLPGSTPDPFTLKITCFLILICLLKSWQTESTEAYLDWRVISQRDKKNKVDSSLCS